MGLRRLLLGGLLALLGPASGGDARADELELRDPPRRPARAGEQGHRVVGPGFVTWQESPLEARSWARALDPPRPLATACGLCGRIVGPDGIWRAPAAAHPPREELSHGFCPPCARQHHPDLFDDL
jgi:hypothetical protein